MGAVLVCAGQCELGAMQQINHVDESWRLAHPFNIENTTAVTNFTYRLNGSGIRAAKGTIK